MNKKDFYHIFKKGDTLKYRHNVKTTLLIIDIKSPLSYVVLNDKNEVKIMSKIYIETFFDLIPYSRSPLYKILNNIKV